MKPALTIVIPLLDEKGTLRELHARITRVVREMGGAYELLFIDDGSRDGSGALLDELAAEDERVGVIHFRRNFGKSAALDAGFRRAKGDVVITMDADLQDDPKEIPRLVAALFERDLDVVSGWKQKRQDPLGKTLPSKLFNATVRTLTGLKLNDFNCGFKAYRVDAVQGMDLYGELHRYIPVLVNGRGFTVGEIPVEHHPRTYGRSKYGVERMAKGFFDLLTVILLTRYRRRPLHLFGWAGLSSAGVGFALLAYLTVLKVVFGAGIGNRPLLFLGVLLLVLGVQLISTGLLGEMINSTRSVTPSYLIAREHLGSLGEAPAGIGDAPPEDATTDDSGRSASREAPTRASSGPKNQSADSRAKTVLAGAPDRSASDLSGVDPSVTDPEPDGETPLRASGAS